MRPASREQNQGATAHTQHQASQHPRTGRKTGLNHLGRGPGKTAHRGPEACVATYAPDRHRDALPRHRTTLSSRSAPEMKAARERPGPPAWSAKSLSSDRAAQPSLCTRRTDREGRQRTPTTNHNPAPKARTEEREQRSRNTPRNQRSGAKSDKH
jgi:hypothetical protein